jgi:hypothetical protein
LSNAYVYLQDASKKPPMEDFSLQPAHILGPSNSLGRISVSVPEGSYYLRITKRHPQNGTDKFGPPQRMDYTWYQTSAVTINTNETTDLGTKYAESFSTPITLKEDH